MLLNVTPCSPTQYGQWQKMLIVLTQELLYSYMLSTHQVKKYLIQASPLNWTQKLQIKLDIVFFFLKEPCSKLIMFWRLFFTTVFSSLSSMSKSNGREVNLRTAFFHSCHSDAQVFSSITIIMAPISGFSHFFSTPNQARRARINGIFLLWACSLRIGGRKTTVLLVTSPLGQKGKQGRILVSFTIASFFFNT